jgi:hypothetical protein
MCVPLKLFRFDERIYAESFVSKGSVSFGAAATYNDSLLTAAQQDNEQERSTNLNPARHRLAVSASDGTLRPLQNLTALKITHKATDRNGAPLRYYILSCSLNNSATFYDKFGKDCHVAIHDPREFMLRLNTAVSAQLPDSGGEARQVTYFRCDTPITSATTLDLLFMKADSYSWQEEYRFVLLGPGSQAQQKRVTLTLGSLTDICSLHLRQKCGA